MRALENVVVGALMGCGFTESTAQGHRCTRAYFCFLEGKSLNTALYVSMDYKNVDNSYGTQ